MKKYIGVTLLNKGKLRWRAQIVRLGITFHIGNYATPNEAITAYDDAAYHLKHWNRSVTNLNEPEKWTQDSYDPLPSTKRILAELRKRYPDFEALREERNRLTGLELLEREGLDALSMIDRSRETVRQSYCAAVARIRVLEAKNKAAEEQIKKLMATVNGLRAQGGTQFFRKVDGKATPTTEVDSHLS